MNLEQLLPFLVPLILVQLILLVITIRHILTHDHYKNGSRLLWLIVVIIGLQFWGPVLYYIFGREDA